MVEQKIAIKMQILYSVSDCNVSDSHESQLSFMRHLTKSQKLGFSIYK
jgi:hypothetical protein